MLVEKGRSRVFFFFFPGSFAGTTSCEPRAARFASVRGTSLLQLVVPGDFAGRLIGRKGANVQEGLKRWAESAKGISRISGFAFWRVHPTMFHRAGMGQPFTVTRAQGTCQFT